jgi:hypothetical protein
MTIVYKIETGKFDPISYGTNYLYNQYDRIQSFLNRLDPVRYRQLLAKPVLSNGQVLWYANFSNPFSRLSDLPESRQTEIKTRYWEVRQLLDREIVQLDQSRDTERQSWANLLREVFNEEDNVILSDGENWCLLWGWKFRNSRENYLAPEFMPRQTETTSPISDIPIPGGPVDDGAAQPSAPISGPISPLPPEGVPLPKPEHPGSFRNPTLWDRIKRFLRTAVYRFWGLMLLVMLLLFLMCLFKQCRNQKLRENCRELEQLNRGLIDLEKKVKDRCNDSL